MSDKLINLTENKQSHAFLSGETIFNQSSSTIYLYDNATDKLIATLNSGEKFDIGSNITFKVNSDNQVPLLISSNLG